MIHPLYVHRRRGAAIIMALTALAVLTMIMAVITLQVYSQRQLARQRQHQLQAQWLARAGVELAAAALIDNAAAFTKDYSGLAPDGKVHVVVEKMNQGIYLVTSEAEVGFEESPLVVRTVSVRFRLTDADGVVRVQTVPGE